MKVVITKKLPYNISTHLAGFKLEYNQTEEPLPVPRLRSMMSDAEGLICTLDDQIDRVLIDSSPNLRVIANFAVGYNNIDVEYARHKGITVCNTPHALTETTAELAFALMISSARRIAEAERFTRSGRFSGWTPNLFLGTDLYGKTVGVFGMGRIGQAFARCCSGFNMEVIYHNRKRNLEAELNLNVTYAQFDELLTWSDFIVITAPLSAETKGRFTMKEFKMMKKTAHLINIGRGPIVNESDLVSALSDGIIAGAGLDVFENEPVIHPGLYKLDNAIILPHIGSASVATRAEMAKMCADSVIAVLKEGTTPPNAL